MRFKKLELENFKSFNGSHVVDLSAFSQGLNFLTGDNRVEPELGANGSGKSTLFDAIFWCLYGKTVRNLKASNVRHWQQEGKCSVKLAFSINDKNYELLRTWNPNALKLNNKTIKQEDLEDLIGLNGEAFKQAVLVGQFNRMFFDMGAADKLSLFSEILGLQYWVDRSSAASSRAKELEKQEQGVNQELSSLDGQIKQLEGSLAEVHELSQQFYSDQQSKVSSLSEQLQQLSKEIDDAEAAYQTAEADYRANAEGTEELRQELETAREERQRLENRRSELRSKQTRLADRVSELRERYDSFDSLESVCPTCEQEVDEGHRESCKQELREQIHSKEQKLSSLEKKEQKARSKVEEYDEVIQEIKEDIQTKQKQERKYAETVESAKSELQKIKSKHERTQDRLQEEQERSNPYEKQVQDYEQRLEKARNSYDEEQKKLNEVSEEREGAQYWAKAFKELRLFVVEEALSNLEIEVNNHLIELGLKDWEIHFDVERETKSGSVSKGFQVLVHSPHNKEPVPWEAWSGGEAQRLRLAGTMGLSSLILNSKGLDPNFIVFDEPSQHLSEEGIEDLLDALYNKAHTEERGIILVDHRSITYGGFDTSTTIVKENEGSYVA